MMRARFNQSFKIQAVEKAFSRRGDTTLKEVADSLGVGHSTLNRWMVQSRHPEFESITATESSSLRLMSKVKRP
jgi:transposase-like protein